MRKFLLALSCLVVGACASINPWAAPPPAYVVFFEGHSLVLSPDAKTIVDHAAAEARGRKGAMVQIAGPSTRIAPGYNPRDAQPRIDAVIHELLVQGVAQNQIVQSSLTTDTVKVDTTGAQRVEIRIVKAGG